MKTLKLKKLIPYLIVVYVTVMMIIFPENSIMYARQAIDICKEVIIPSLFPFFICSGLLIYSGLSKTLSQICKPIMKPLFNVSGCGAAALVLGIISGYPLGAVTACQLYESGYLSKSETERLLAFCNNSGPLFILGAVGAAIYSGRQFGIVLYVSHILAALTVGIIFRFYAPGKHSAPAYEISQPERSFSEVFSQVLASSLNSILTVCGAVIFFSVISGIITSQLPVNDILKAFFSGIMELTGGTKSISETTLSLTEKLVMSAFVVGFAGLCVHLQVIAIVSKQGLSLIPYFFGKLLHGTLAALYTLIYFKIFPPKVSVFMNNAAALDAGFCMGSLYSVINVLFFTLLAAFIIFFSASATKSPSSVER
ncbi:MAG: hypothetical protein J6C82_04580 [Clostridia bacterium]|nr:hypothetical protein [Clostridia bacterium]